MKSNALISGSSKHSRTQSASMAVPRSSLAYSRVEPLLEVVQDSVVDETEERGLDAPADRHRPQRQTVRGERIARHVADERLEHRIEGARLSLRAPPPLVQLRERLHRRLEVVGAPHAREARIRVVLEEAARIILDVAPHRTTEARLERRPISRRVDERRRDHRPRSGPRRTPARADPARATREAPATATADPTRDPAGEPRRSLRPRSVLPRAAQ